MYRPGSALAAVAALLLLVGGCDVASGDTAESPSPRAPVAEPVISAIPVIESTAAIRLPLDAYELTYDERAAVALTEARLVRACAARFGVNFDIPADQVLANAIGAGTYDTNKSRHAHRYGHNDIAVVREHGYLVPPGLPGQPSGEWIDPITNDPYIWVVMNGLEPGPQPPELGGASGRLEGSYPTGLERPSDIDGDPLPQGGCAGEAASVLSGDGEVYDDIYVENLNDEPYFLALEDSRVAAVTEAWSACMAEKGYDYDAPEDASIDPAWFAVGPDGTIDESQRPKPEEIVTAVADVECQQSVNYLGVHVTVESAYQEQLIEEHFQDLELNYRNAQAMLQRANAVSGGTS